MCTYWASNTEKTYTINEASDYQKVGTVTFAHSDKSEAISASVPFESTYGDNSSSDVSLGDFLARPVLIDNFDYAIDDNNRLDSFNPWKDFLENDLVRRRIEGFRHVRGTMNVRFVVTGNPFMSGRLVAAYEPKAPASMHVKVSRFSGAIDLQLTQLPHIYLDAATSQGGEIEAPFFHEKNWIDLAGTRDLANMGEVFIHQITPIRHTQSTATVGTVSVRVFAWMTGAELAGPTSAIYGTYVEQGNIPYETVGAAAATSSILYSLYKVIKHFSFQSKCESIEDQDSVNAVVTEQAGFMDSPVSNTASTVARAAGLLREVPGFSAYALATEAAASTVGRIASLFGFSRPNVLEKMIRYKSYEGGLLSPGNDPEVVQRLGYDLKGELTVDPRTVGLNPIDEMSFLSIASKETLIDSTTWTTEFSDLAPIRSVNITPTYFRTDTNVNPARSVLCPMAALAAGFKYWRGTINIRISIVGSVMHRGRLRISYDPAASASTASGYNQVYSRVIDLETCRDVTFPVAWHAPTPYLSVDFKQIGGVAYETGNSILMNPDAHNGQIIIQPVTQLTAPDQDATGTVDVLIFASAGDDFELAVPTDRVSRDGWSYKSSDPAVQPQSGAVDSEKATDNATAESPIEHEMMGTNSDPVSDHTNKVFMGESIVSLRTLLKRYNIIGTNTNSSNFTTHWNRFPIDEDSGKFIGYHEFYTCCYAGWRGTIRWKHRATSTGMIMASRIERGRLGIPSGIPSTENLWRSIYSGHEGSAWDAGVIQIELPYYSKHRFSYARTHPMMTDDTSISEDFNLERYVVANSRQSTLDPDEFPRYACWAAGEDFSLYHWIGLPPIYALGPQAASIAPEITI